MKRKQNRTLVFFSGSMTVLLLVIGLLIFSYMRGNRLRIADQNRQYLEDAASQTVEHIDKIFDNAEISIRMVARLYELQLTGPEFDYHMLDNMAEPTPFDYIRFVATDGISWAGDGTTADCLDRDYYIEGLKGNTGLTYIDNSRFVSHPILVFYTPLYYQGEIIGVVNGIFDTEKFAGQIDTSFFGYPSYPCILKRDGSVIISTITGEEDATKALGRLMHYDSISEDEVENIKKALAENRALSFRYTGENGDGIAYLSPVAGGQYMLVQSFPAAATNALAARANRDAIRLEISLVAIFLVYIISVAVFYIRTNKSLSREKAYLNQIVTSVQRLYRMFLVIDLSADTYEYLREGGVSEFESEGSGSYSVWLEKYTAVHNENPDYWGSPEEMTPERLKETLTKENWATHMEYRTPDGRWERLSLLKLDLEHDVTTRILGAVEDITDARLRDEENRHALETAFHAAEAASHAKSDFLSRMSHDIRTPMNAIIGLTAIMGAHLDDRDRLIDCLSKITSSSRHLLALINEVLDMSKIESGKFVLTETEFSLSTLVDELLDIVRPMVNAKHQELTVQIHDIVHEDVIGDVLRFRQVCVNILSNAVKYTGEGGHIGLSIYERPGSQPSVAKYEFVIEDDGIGMSKEFLARLFSPFERAEDERVSSTQGTGLGMTIAQSIIQLMGGNIYVESEPGEGSVFTVRVPFRLQEVNEAAAEYLVGLPVLVADDEQIACETACLMLNELGMESEWVLTGEKAVSRVKERHDREEDFFAVILDWKMPGMDGVETARQIRKAVGPEVPIIILSSYDWSDIENEARTAGVNAFIAKPLFKSRLRGMFINLITSTAPEQTENPLSALDCREYAGKKALLVEDNALNQEIAKEILEMTGLSVDVAENGSVAVERFNGSDTGYYDIIFMDIQMPVMNGLEATRAIRALSREDAAAVPIVAMTANTFSEDVQTSLAAGMVEHIGKPLDIRQLMDVLKRQLSHFTI